MSFLRYFFFFSLFRHSDKVLLYFFRPVRNSSQPQGYRPDTGVDAICTYRNDSTMPAFDRVKVYHELVNLTDGFTKMEPYHLDRYSLYVNGSQVT